MDSQSLIRSILAAGLALATLPVHAEFTGRVVAVADGDTITVLDNQHHQHKIRLAGIDAPEKAQAFGQASKRHLSDLVFDRNVTLDCGKTDKYLREVCVVTIDGKDANRAQVAAGMAWWYPEVPEGADGAPEGRLRGRRGIGEGFQSWVVAGC